MAHLVNNANHYKRQAEGEKSNGNASFFLPRPLDVPTNSKMGGAVFLKWHI